VDRRRRGPGDPPRRGRPTREHRRGPPRGAVAAGGRPHRADLAARLEPAARRARVRSVRAAVAERDGARALPPPGRLTATGGRRRGSERPRLLLLLADPGDDLVGLALRVLREVRLDPLQDLLVGEAVGLEPAADLVLEQPLGLDVLDPFGAGPDPRRLGRFRRQLLVGLLRHGATLSRW